MSAIAFQKAKFIKTAVKFDQYPTLRDLSGDILPEIAVAGRSNVGKSSLLNSLFQNKGMVKTSSTPGKTQAINFFTVDDKLAVVDLPGYGYAQVPPAVRKQWGPMVHDYLQKREPLQLILFLFDIRRLPNEDDKRFLEWVAHSQKAMIMVFTKIDKVTLNEKKQNTQKILKEFDTENLHYIYYSVTKNVGRKELLHMVFDALRKDEDEDGTN